MRETQIEKHLIKEVTKLNGACRKWVCPGRKGVPDRICIFPGNLIYFIECKTIYGKLSSIQRIEISTLKLLGCDVRVIESIKDVDNLIAEVIHLMSKNPRGLKPQ